MKRVRVGKGKHVLISVELAEKAELLLGTGLSRDAARDLAASEPKLRSTLMAGSPKPLATVRRPSKAGKKPTDSK